MAGEAVCLSHADVKSVLLFSDESLSLQSLESGISGIVLKTASINGEILSQFNKFLNLDFYL